MLIVFGLIIRSWKIYDWKKEQAIAEQENQDTEQRQNDNDWMKQLVDAGIIADAEDLIKVITALNERDEEEAKEKSFFEEFKEILMFAFLMIIVIMMIQQMGKGGA